MAAANRLWRAFLLLLLLGLLSTATVRAEDDNEQCGEWASMGECEANPGYMLSHCAEACAEAAKQGAGEQERALPSSIYDIVEKDLDGNDVAFSDFRGQVVYVVNVASHCGYTQENYNMFRKLAKYRKNSNFEIVLAPCNQFGQQEPGDGVAITNFARKQDFEGIILSKADVNGRLARPVFRFLKHAAGVASIGWNFDGKFLVSKTGEVFHVSDNRDIESMIKELLAAK